MSLKKLMIAGVAATALTGCSKAPSPTTMATAPAAPASGALSQDELDAYISWSREYEVFGKAHMKRVPELANMLSEAAKRGETAPPEEYQRYQREAAAKDREIMSRRPLTVEQQDAVERTIAAVLRFQPNSGSSTLVWEIHHNDEALGVLRKRFGAEMIDRIVARERRFLDLKNQ
jgi:hypothetical protein